MKIINVLAFAAAAAVLPVAAFAQASAADVAYCKAMSAKYRDFNKGDPQANVAAAMAGCDNRTSEAIPILEKQLKDDKIPLPTR